MDALLYIGLLLLTGGIAYRVGRSKNLPATAPERIAAGDGSEELYQVAASIDGFFNATAHPSDLLGHPAFESGVSLLAARPVETLIGYYTGDSLSIACMALEALVRRPDGSEIRRPVLDGINDYAPWNRFFALRVLDAQTPAGEPIVGVLLTSLDESWTYAPNPGFLGEFLRTRIERDEKLTLGRNADDLDEHLAGVLTTVLGRLPDDLAATLRAELDSWRATRIDREFLDAVGRIWTADDEDGENPVLLHASLETHVARIAASLLGEPRRSTMMVGEPGVGKTSIGRVLARRLAEKGWIVFEAGHAELIAGQVYIGQLEERLRELLKRLDKRPVVWFVPEFHALALSGRHQYSPTSVIDNLLPYIEKGDVVVLGETVPAAYERLVQSKPRLLTAMETCRIAPLAEQETLELVDRWAETQAEGSGATAVEPNTRREAWLISQQYLGDHAAPGNVLKLLELTRVRLRAGSTKRGSKITVDDLIATLSQLTGLPSAILDERQGLDLSALREQFQRCVMGQPEAVDCLVERVAMIKAGVTDPTRPLGVFLFAGPTGTGKTEIAKTLADFLFGSPDRMIRLDMSEFQDPESLNRILGETGSENRADPGGALVDRIRKQPFSVVLLDEFEKSHQSVWDLFLQVFDDGRLTDRRGNTSDFRNAIVIMTSNLGSMIPSGSNLGFGDESGRFSSKSVQRTVERSFRKEFLNRIDRTVVFRPLDRETMREILRKELAEAFHRRGLRNRTWAVEWDDSAIEFLLEQGFTPDLGARPLKRAIEHHMLAPLALTIVNHQYPAGDQFLFVRAERGKLAVDFVDPDAPDPEVVSSETIAGAHDAVPSLEHIALEPRGVAEEIAVLQSDYTRLGEVFAENAWHEGKQAGLEQTRAPGFWSSPGRHQVLGRIEYLDRLEAGLRTAGSLLDRLRGSDGRSRDRFPREIVRRLAQQLYLLDAACRGVLTDQPREAFVLVEAWSDTGTPSKRAETFARQVGGMYRAWADKRRMQCETLEESGGDERHPYRVLFSIGGYAAFPILQPEHGLHLKEFPDGEGKGFQKAATRVRVVPQPEMPPTDQPHGLAAQAHAEFAEQGADGLAIVRRYREEPSPLVRDTVRGWRTGRLDRVLSGDFDLIRGQV